jgi:hypothetical protein
MASESKNRCTFICLNCTLIFYLQFTEDLEKEMRKTFEISDETEVRLWYKYMSNTYEHLSKKESTLHNSWRVKVKTVPV